MRPLDNDRSYCDKDEQLYLAKEHMWSEIPPLQMTLDQPTATEFSNSNQEIMLAQEQNVLMKWAGVKKRLEGGLGGELTGTLVLTNQRLIFVGTEGTEEHFQMARSSFSVFYSDVEDLASIPQEPNNLFIDIYWISNVRGRRGGLTRPSLEVSWVAGLQEERRVFVQQVTTGGNRKKDLSDWASVILRLRDGSQSLLKLRQLPTVETLEGKALRVLGDMQRKGLFMITRQVEEEFNIKVDSDELQSALDSLCQKGFVRRVGIFYQRISPLGDDDLSS